MERLVSPAAAVAARRKEIEEDMDRLRAQIGAAHTALDAYRSELAELDIAERVWERLEPKVALPAPSATDRPETPSPPIPTARKPAGTPTVADMIIAALKDSRRLGQRGLEPKAMTAYIANRWWPGAKVTDVGPIAWRMWKKQGVLQNEGGLYLLPESSQNDLPPTQEATERRQPETIAA